MTADRPASAQIAPPVRALLEGLFDYAGLFPPSALSMDEATANFHAYRNGDLSWMLGRFVVPAGRLVELVDATKNFEFDSPWPLSVLVKDWAVEALILNEFQDRHRGRFQIAAVETRQQARRPALNGEPTVYVEFDRVAPAKDQAESLDEGEAAKLRAGGLAANDFPDGDEVIRFLNACQQTRVGFKATAGLHHATPAERPTCSSTDAPIGAMHGFLNLALTVVLLDQPDADAAADLLAEPEIANLTFTEQEVGWRGIRFTVEEIVAARKRFHSIGSCSFETPTSELHAAGWL